LRAKRAISFLILCLCGRSFEWVISVRVLSPAQGTARTDPKADVDQVDFQRRPPAGMGKSGSSLAFYQGPFRGNSDQSTDRENSGGRHSFYFKEILPNKRYQTMLDLLSVLDVSGEIADEHMFLAGNPEIQRKQKDGYQKQRQP
jgi:hypothetical protein